MGDGGSVLLNTSASRFLIAQARSVFEFDDCRAFLKAYVDFRKAKNSSWSLGMWARSMRLSSASTLSMVLSGQRNVGHELAERMVSYLEFTAAEREYFLDLVELQDIRKLPRLKLIVREYLRNARSAFKPEEIRP